MKKLLLPLLLLAQPAQPALTAEEALTKCRQIEEIAERVVCYDKIEDSHFPTDSIDADSINVDSIDSDSIDADSIDSDSINVDSRDADSTVRVEVTTPPEATKSNVVPDAQSLFGTNDAEAKRIVETSLAIEQISEIEAIVTDVRESANEKLTVTLDDGQIWHQLDNKPLHLKSGETVIVRKASLGSYLMEKKSGSRSIRVKREN